MTVVRGSGARDGSRTTGPIASVVIAAHDEADTIGRCLGSLLHGAAPGELEVVVVCNGCSDGTAAAARGHDVQVVELVRASKAAALRAGDRRASVHPRVYLDADVLVTARGVRRMVEALDHPGVLACSTSLELDTSGASRAHRGYLEIWQRLPSVRSGLVGRGVYALSAEGRARFGAFPDLLNDDGFVDSLFADGERTILADVRSTVFATGSLRDLVRRKSRVVRGGWQLAASDVAGPTRANRWSWLRVVASEPRLAACAPVYALVATSTRIGAALLGLRRGGPWGARG